ncbi:cyanophycin synthetase [Myroides fluvii]|uniref:cyanophycin synthetase n=1 Tax=Myroides fluvii TaxID=2572594 RepID=UPI00131BB0FC|nr:cyanophycin synthetase [Myroides fluvii]
MIIEKTSVLRGPNIWSKTRVKLIQMRLNLEELEQSPTDVIDGFSDRLQALLPSLYSHRCSEGTPGGFFSRVSTGTWMGHVVEHIAIEIQSLAGMQTGFGRTRETSVSGTYHVVFDYEEENAGLFAASAAVEIGQALVDGVPYDLDVTIQKMKEMYQRFTLGPSTLSIVKEAEIRNIPWTRLDNQSLIQLGYGVNQMRIQATITCKTSHIAVGLACDKEKTKLMLKQSAIPVAEGGVCINQNQLKQLIKKIGYPLVLKPLDGNQGKGVSINILDFDSASQGLIHAQQYSERVIVEQFITGYDFRILVINNKVVAASKRVPAHIVGDGVRTIEKLIELTNKDSLRGKGHENLLTKIEVDRDTLNLLSKRGLQLDSIVEDAVIVDLKSTANLSTGGTALDVTDQIHPENMLLAERIARVIGLDICGIDIMAVNLTTPIKENGGMILEVNAAPGFRMHLAPSEGMPRNVAAPVLDMLYPQGKESRIPILAVTGTNGKTTTTRLLAHIAKGHGLKVGFTTSDGIYIDHQLMEKGDTTGPISAQYVLRDPTVELAILETARGGILRAGLGFTSCDIAIITNIKEDHLDLDDIHTLSDLAKVKAVVVESVKSEGWAILNADDPYCMKISATLHCQVAYFSLDENSPIIEACLKRGEIVAVYENGYITIKKENWKIRIEKVRHVPLTMQGKAKFMVQNVLAATLASYVYGFELAHIRISLQSFLPSVTQTPGRMNVFEFKKFKIMVDFAHNPAGYLAIEDYLTFIEASRKIGIIAGVGDRRDEDIIQCGKIAARMFDHIIIRQETNLRGRTEEEIIQLLLIGITSVDKQVTYQVIPKEIEAIKHAISIAKEGNYIVALSDVVSNALNLIQSYLENDQ